MRKLSNNRRAVSPVIATVLMILVTMVGMTLLFAFVSSYSDNYKAGVGSSVMESITVEDIWLRSGLAPNYNCSVVFSVYNVGKIDLKINSLYVNGLRLATSFSPNTSIKVGEHVSIPATYLSQSWRSGVSYNFRIVTQSGSNFDVTYKAP